MPDIESAFPELNAITDPELRTAVHECWQMACEENDIESLDAVEWFPPIQREYNIEDETLIDHVRDVVGVACASAKSLERT